MNKNCIFFKKIVAMHSPGHSDSLVNCIHVYGFVKIFKDHALMARAMEANTTLLYICPIHLQTSRKQKGGNPCTCVQNTKLYPCSVGYETCYIRECIETVNGNNYIPVIELRPPMLPIWRCVSVAGGFPSPVPAHNLTML